MSGLRTPIFLRVPKYNSDAHENVEAEFDVSQKQQYIEQEKYAMSIQRVVVPTSKIKHVHIEDNYDQYFVAVKPDGSQEAVDGADNSGVPSSYIPTDFLSFGQLLDDRVGQTTWLSNTQTLGVDGVELDNYVNMEAYFNQSAQFIYENINRAIVRAYLGGLWNITWNQHVDLPVAYYPRSHYKQMDVIIRHDRTHNWIAYDHRCSFGDSIPDGFSVEIIRMNDVSEVKIVSPELFTNDTIISNVDFLGFLRHWDFKIVDDQIRRTFDIDIYHEEDSDELLVFISRNEDLDEFTENCNCVLKRE